MLLRLLAAALPGLATPLPTAAPAVAAAATMATLAANSRIQWLAGCLPGCCPFPEAPGRCSQLLLLPLLPCWTWELALLLLA